MHFHYANGQNLIPANPIESIILNQNINNQSLLIRPIINSSNNIKWFLKFRNEMFYSQNYPNFENLGNRYVGRGLGFFTSYSFLYLSDHILFGIEPFYLINENKSIKIYKRESPYGDFAPDIFNVLNNNRINTNKPYEKFGLRESTLFLHYNGLGFGISNANMWWGPGLHTSLTMTNNTTGFPYIMIGSIYEKKFKSVKYNFRYIFSKLDKISGDPYYSALVFFLKFYNNPTITLGFSRNYLSGGLPTDRRFTVWDAVKLPFEWLFIDTKEDKYPIDWEAHDRWDQTLSFFIDLYYSKPKINIYCEIGTDDHRQNWSDLRSHPEHNSAIIIGLRKFNLFNNNNIFSGFEYANIKQSFTHKFRGGGHWWSSPYYAYSTYDGRRWAAHSGSDSDDLYIFLGIKNGNYLYMPAFNFERHGIVFGKKPEVKIEFKLNLYFHNKDYLYKIRFEHEFINNIAFTSDDNQKNNAILIGIEKKLNSMKFKLIK